MRNNNSHFQALLNYLTAIIRPVQLHYQLVSERIVRRKIMRQNNLQISSKFEQLIHNIHEKEKELKIHMQLQLGLETVYQLMGTSILLNYAYSDTKTNQGLTALFEQGEFSFMAVTLSSELVVGILLVMNLLSFIKAHYNGFVEGYALNYKFAGIILLLTSIICGVLVRIMSTTLFFSPSLGLFNLLRHYQGILIIQ